MFGYMRNMAFRGLVNNISAGLLKSMNLPQEALALVVPMSVMVAHASSPTAKFGVAEVDAAIALLPQPIVDADTAGRIANRYAYLHEINLDECLQQQYGKSLNEMMVFLKETCLDIGI